MTALAHGDFTGLAETYARFRPGYAESALTALLALHEAPADQLDAADIGAGTGIWTRMLAARGLRSVTAVEPNDDMRACGLRDNAGAAIWWRAGTAEATGLAAASCDLVCMASSFHWADFDRATQEFHRTLRRGGRFVALWNPRHLDHDPALLDIEAYVARLKPEVRRVSSGRSGLAEQLMERLSASRYFGDVVYVEARHSVRLTVAHYLGAWRSVNDLQVQLGPEKFDRLLEYASNRLTGRDSIEAVYITRAWSARSF